MAAERFRRTVERALASRPLRTPLGSVREPLEDVLLGSPSGRHNVPSAWVYQRDKSVLEMVLQFYGNFTSHDLICKVVRASEYPKGGEGASVQFNSNHCVRNEAQHAALIHRGRVTIHSSLARSVLVDAMRHTCPTEMKSAGIRTDRGAWPCRIGSSANVPALLDSIFLYAYCIEQAKRCLRAEDPFPPLTP